MAAINVLYLPGIFGSGLRFTLPVIPAPIYIWITPGSVLSAELIQLELAADGVSPGPHTWGVPLQPGGLFFWQYGILGGFMSSLGWNVLGVAFDWRQSVLVTAQAVYNATVAAFGRDPFVIVAHSMGGLLARAVYRLFVGAGLDLQVAGLVTLGAPHFGSWMIVRSFFGLPELYKALLWAGGIFGPVNPAYRPDFLDVALASWPGFYEMLPWRDSGPLAIADPATAQALYQLPTYALGNRYVSAALMAAAVQTQHALGPAYPINRTRCIRGVGFVTPYEVNPPNPLTTDAGYAFNGNGDGYVPLDYATLTGVVPLDIPVSHGQLPTDPIGQRAVAWAVRSLPGIGPGA